MSWDALRDRDSGRPRRHDSQHASAVTPSVRAQGRKSSLEPKSRSLRPSERTVAQAEVAPATIEEELWFGGHDASIAEDAAARSMAALVGRIVGAKPFPESARKLAELTRKDVLRIEPIIQVLERDPGLSARLLRLVNSAGYALRQRCTSVRHAATLVGTDRLHQIATTAAVLDLFDARGSVAAKIVEHSTIVGAFCRYFGAHLALPVDDLFTAGFLHDIGKLMLLETEGEQYFSLLEKYGDRPDSIHIVERSLFGFDHAVLAAHVLTEWNIPDPVPKIVAWHHDPTRAYRVSSMMAALVQTVRLADLAVYAMIHGVDQQQFSTLASTESASYLDISEPQLSSMWDELQTLYRESIEQCRGENAPALDPRSLRPKQPINISVTPDAPRSTELPLQFPCVVCGKPSFGNQCRACGGHMCPEHQEGREDWCTLCARDFYREAEETHPVISNRVAIAIALSTILISTSIGYETRGINGGIRAAIGTLLLLALTAVLIVVGRRLLLRFRFVRTRPDRAVDEPQESDGGLLSLVPPTIDATANGSLSTHDPLTEQLRRSGAAIERVMIREVPSIPSILAPKPFEGLTEAHPPSSRRVIAEQEAAHATTTTLPQFPSSLSEPMIRSLHDNDRLAQQGRSLVTLPVPARAAHDSLDVRPTPTARDVDEHVDLRPSRSAIPIRPEESIDVGTDERTSELGLNALPATPPSEPPLERFSSRPAESSKAVEPSTSTAPGDSARESGTYPSTPPPALPEPPASPPPDGESLHPLAVLGIHPNKYAKPSRHNPDALKYERVPDAAPPLEQQTTDRQTLVGISANEIHQQLTVTPNPAEPTRIDKTPSLAEETLAEEALVDTPSPVFADAPITRVVQSPPSTDTESSKQVTDEVRHIPNLSELDQTGFEQRILAQMGPEFQTQVMNLVAERVAQIMAERMLESFSGGAQKSAPVRSSRAPQGRKVPATTETPSMSPKGSRRKAQAK